MWTLWVNVALLKDSLVFICPLFTGNVFQYHSGKWWKHWAPMNIHERHTRYTETQGQTGTDWDSKNKWSSTMNHKKNIYWLLEDPATDTLAHPTVKDRQLSRYDQPKPTDKTVITSARPNSGKDQRTQRPYLGPSHLWGKVLWGQINQTPPFNVDQGEITGTYGIYASTGCVQGTGGCPCTSIITTSGSFEASLR